MKCSVALYREKREGGISAFKREANLIRLSVVPCPIFQNFFYGKSTFYLACGDLCMRYSVTFIHCFCSFGKQLKTASNTAFERYFSLSWNCFSIPSLFWSKKKKCNAPIYLGRDPTSKTFKITLAVLSRHEKGTFLFGQNSKVTTLKALQ